MIVLIYFNWDVHLMSVDDLNCCRSHLREIRDRSVLRLFESNEVAAPQVLPGGPGVPQPLPANGGHWDQDQVKTKMEFFFILNGDSYCGCCFVCVCRAISVNRNSTRSINISTFIKAK